MAKRDRSAEAVAWECAEMVRNMLRPGQGPTPEHVKRAALAIIRAERTRVRRIVRRERAQWVALQNDPESFDGGGVGVQACDDILAALREGKGTR